MSLTVADIFATCFGVFCVFFVVKKENMENYMAGESKIISESFVSVKCFSN